MAFRPGKVRFFDKKAAAPGATDDASLGYRVSDLWLDETNDAYYVCIDNTATAAVWAASSASAGFVAASNAEFVAQTISNKAVVPSNMAIAHSVNASHFKGSINTEVLAATKTLIVTDLMVQWLDPDGFDRDVVLPAEASSTYLLFIVLNTADGVGEDLVVKNDGGTTIATLAPGMSGVFSCDGTDWRYKNDNGILYDSIAITLNISGTLITGSIEAEEDSEAITLFDMPVSATPAAGTEMSATCKIDGDNVLTFGAYADSAGGVTGHFIKNHGAAFVHKTDGGAADYNPSILTSDYIISVDTTAAARAVTISAEDKATGTTTKPRVFIIQDIAGNAGTNNITVSLETAGTINGAATAVISANYNSITLIIDGTNAYII